MKIRVNIPASHSHTGKERWDYKPIDACISNYVKALNMAGLKTLTSCCGHGNGDSQIDMQNGDVIIIKRKDL